MARSIRKTLVHAALAVFSVAAAAVGAPAVAQTSYDYDGLGRLVRVERDDGTVTQYAYDAADNRALVLESEANKPFFTVADVSAEEGGALVFTVVKNGATTLTHAVSYATSNGMATAGSDYTAASGTLTFTSAQTEKTVTVTTSEDTTVEADETFTLVLSAPTNGAQVSGVDAVGTVENDDYFPDAVDDGATAYSGTPLSIYVLANDDPGGGTLTITSVTQPFEGSVSIAGGGTHVVYTGYNSGPFTILDEFTYTISNGLGGSDTASVYIGLQGGGGF